MNKKEQEARRRLENFRSLNNMFGAGFGLWATKPSDVVIKTVVQRMNDLWVALESVYEEGRDDGLNAYAEQGALLETQLAGGR
jgi:hypothetical protein